VRGIHKSAWLLAIGSGILQVLVFPRPGLSFLCWVALAPLIYAILRAREGDATQLLTDEAFSYLVPARPWQGFLLGTLSGTLFYLGSCYWVVTVMHQHGGISRGVSVLLMLAFAFVLGLHHGAFGLLLAWAARSRPGYNRRALALAPFFWVSVEMLRAYGVSYPWQLLGTAQVNNIPLARIASVTGVWGVSFEIALVNAAFAAIFLVPRARRLAMLLAALAAAVALQSTQLIKLEPFPAEYSATLVQQNVPLDFDWTAQSYEQKLDEFEQMSRMPQQGGATQVVVWPEAPTPFFTNDTRFVATTARIARENHAYVIAGSLGEPPPGNTGREDVFNSAVLVAPDGNPAGRYDKIHLVPFGEYIPFARWLRFAQSLTHAAGTFLRGTRREPLLLGGHKYGVFICYESIFPSEVRVFAQRGAEVFVNISNDTWFGDGGAPWHHLDIARMRAIENHRWLLRCTNSGITAVIDPYGRVTQQLPRKQALSLNANYGLMTGVTFYTRCGDWFPALCVIISLAGLLWRRHGAVAELRPQLVKE